MSRLYNPNSRNKGRLISRIPQRPLNSIVPEHQISDITQLAPVVRQPPAPRERPAPVVRQPPVVRERPVPVPKAQPAPVVRQPPVARPTPVPKAQPAPVVRQPPVRASVAIVEPDPEPVEKQDVQITTIDDLPFYDAVIPRDYKSVAEAVNMGKTNILINSNVIETTSFVILTPTTVTINQSTTSSWTINDTCTITRKVNTVLNIIGLYESSTLNINGRDPSSPVFDGNGKVRFNDIIIYIDSNILLTTAVSLGTSHLTNVVFKGTTDLLRIADNCKLDNVVSLNPSLECAPQSNAQVLIQNTYCSSLGISLTRSGCTVKIYKSQINYIRGTVIWGSSNTLILDTVDIQVDIALILESGYNYINLNNVKCKSSLSLIAGFTANISDTLISITNSSATYCKIDTSTSELNGITIDNFTGIINIATSSSKTSVSNIAIKNSNCICVAIPQNLNKIQLLNCIINVLQFGALGCLVINSVIKDCTITSNSEINNPNTCIVTGNTFATLLIQSESVTGSTQSLALCNNTLDTLTWKGDLSNCIVSDNTFVKALDFGTSKISNSLIARNVNYATPSAINFTGPSCNKLEIVGNTTASGLNIALDSYSRLLISNNSFDDAIVISVDTGDLIVMGNISKNLLCGSNQFNNTSALLANNRWTQTMGIPPIGGGSWETA